MATLAQLAATLLGPNANVPALRLLRAPRRARRRQRIPKQRPPSGAALEYSKALRAAVAKLEVMTRARILPMLRQDGARMDAPPAADGADGAAISQALAEIEREWLAEVVPQLERAAAKTAERVSTHQEGELRKQLQAMTGANVQTGLRQRPSARFGQAPQQARVRDMLRGFTTENVLLIRSIPEHTLGQVRDQLREGFAKGETHEQLADRIEARFNVARSRAVLIATDQSLTLSAQLNRERQKAIGIATYMWRIYNSPVGDSRVRDDHRELEGTVQQWGRPPVVDDETGQRAEPGEAINCRCTAEPILDDDAKFGLWFAGEAPRG